MHASECLFQEGYTTCTWPNYGLDVLYIIRTYQGDHFLENPPLRGRNFVRDFVGHLAAKLYF